MENFQPKERMMKKSDTGSVIIIAVLSFTTVVSTMLAVLFGICYVRTIREQEAQEAIEAQNVFDAEPEYVEAMGGAGSAADISELLQNKEKEFEASMKEKMKALVTAENGSPLKMLRSFFPENLIYIDKSEYVFAPVLDEVEKHTLLAENFVSSDDGEMQYVENGLVVSHKGIDVSKYQGDIDWAKAASDGVEYAFIRVGIRGYSTGKIALDEYFEKNMEGAAAAGVRTGVYFFSQAVSVDEALEEAEFVLENIAGYDISYPVAFDMEMITNSNGRANSLLQSERTDIAVAFCEKIKAAGYTPMIYGNVKCFTKMLDMARLNDYEKWYAFYDDYMYMPYNVSIWQYTEKGKVEGIDANVDLNISYKEY